MNVYYTDKARSVLDAKMAFIKGKGAQNLSLAIAREVAEGNTYDRINGRDRYGVGVKPLQSVRTGKYKGASGPPLAPFGAQSRVVSAFKSLARQRGGNWQVIAGWVNVVSRSGVPFLPFHDMGGGRLPRRSIFGISPRTWARIKSHLDAFKSGVRKSAPTNAPRPHTVR